MLTITKMMQVNTVLNIKLHSMFTSLEFVFVVAGKLDVRIPLAARKVEEELAGNPSQ